MRVLLVAALLLAACGGQAEPAADPESPVASTPLDPDTPVPSPTALEVDPRDGLVDVGPHVWDQIQVASQTSLVVLFYGGVEECEGLARVEVDETPKKVTITLFTGRVPDAEVCIEIAVLKSVRIELDDPLGDRRIVDGAA